jgi:hypothetical protein
MVEEFPGKPKGMHWRTYNRLRRSHDLAARSSMIGMNQFAGRLGQRLSAKSRPSSDPL